MAILQKILIADWRIFCNIRTLKLMSSKFRGCFSAPHFRISMAGRNWCFTINNPLPSDFPNLEPSEWSDNLKFLIYQSEIGESGTLHLQGYLELKNSRRQAFVKTRLPKAHLEVRKGSRKQAIAYCLKSDRGGQTEDPIVYGFDGTLDDLKNYVSTKNSRNAQLLAIKEAITNNEPEEKIADDNFELWVRHYRAFREFRLLKSLPRNWEVTVHVAQGPTGTGKSRWAMEAFPNAYWKQRSNWWDGYTNQSTVILDEFYGWLPFDTLLRLCDRYPLLLETKGGQVQCQLTTIVITTNSLPCAWYKNVYFPSFVRRVTTWHVFPVWGEHAQYNQYDEALKQMAHNE